MKWVFLLLFSFISFSFQPNSPSFDTLEFYLPEDLQIELWAESPMLFNPTNMDTDHRGRIWVTEAVNYRSFNNDSSEFFHHSQGDRVVILEDSDQDGRADKSTVFVEDKDLVAPLGIAVFGNRVFVSCAPHLLLYTDTNGDDKADTKEIFLTGFGGLDHDHSLHSIVGGPDGKFYFNVGNAGPHVVTDKSGFTIRSGSIYNGGSPHNKDNTGARRSDDGRIWTGGLQFSMLPDGTQLQVLAHNFRNSYETYVDGMGDLWQNDNDDQVVTCRVSWLMPGGNAGFFYADGTRTWQADQRPGQKMATAHWHQEDPGVMPIGDISGAGSPTGVVRLEGDELGKKYRGMLLSADAGRNVLFSYFPEITGSGYNLAGKGSIFLSSNREDDKAYVWNDTKFLEKKSKWFRPSDAVIGTDGALYVADWYDAVVGGHQMKDKDAYGRIYRITQKKNAHKTPNLNLNSLEGCLDAFQNSAVNVRFTATEKLVSYGNQALKPITKLLKSENPFVQARAIWLLSRLENKGLKIVQNLFLNGNNNERIVAARALLAQGQVEFVTDRLISEKDPFLRREAFMALNPETDFQKLAEFSLQDPGPDAFYYPALAFKWKDFEEQFFEKYAHQIPLDLLVHLVPKNAVEKFHAEATSNKDISEKLKALNALAFIPTKEAVNKMFLLANNPQEEIAKQAKYWLAYRKSNDWQELFDWDSSNLNLEEEQEKTQMLAMQERLLNEHIAEADNTRVARRMLKSSFGSQILINLLSEGKIKGNWAKSIQDSLVVHPDLGTRLRAANLFAENQNNNLLDPQTITALKGSIISGETIANTYCTSCHKIKNQGAAVGPDLSAIRNKLDANGILEAVIYPNKGIVFGYEPYTLQLKNGVSYYGFIVGETEKNTSVKDLSGTIHTLKKEEIRSKTMQKESLMPSAASFGLDAQQLSDLTVYLLSI